MFFIQWENRMITSNALIGMKARTNHLIMHYTNGQWEIPCKNPLEVLNDVLVEMAIAEVRTLKTEITMSSPTKSPFGATQQSVNPLLAGHIIIKFDKYLKSE